MDRETGVRLHPLKRGFGAGLSALTLATGLLGPAGTVYAQSIGEAIGPASTIAITALLPSLRVGATVRVHRTASLPGPLVTLQLERTLSTVLPSLDLPRAVNLAVQSQPGIKAALASLAQQTSGIDVARAGYRPQVRAGLAAGRQAESTTGQQLALTVSQMLYDFGKVDSTVAQADAARQQQRAQVLLEIDDLALDTAATLLEAHRQQVLAKQAETLVTALRDIVTLTELRATAGATSIADPITARARLEASQSNLLNFRSQWRQQRSKLQNLISSPLPERLLLPPSEVLQAWAQAPYPDLSTLPAMQAVQAELQLNQATLARTKAQQKPTITLEARLGKPMGGANSTSRSLNHSLTVNLSSSLYQGGAESAQVEAATQGMLSAEARIDSKRRELQERWRQLAEQTAGLQERVQVLVSRQTKLQETRALYREQYLSLGTRSVLDLLNTEQEIFQAMADQMNVQHDLWHAQLQTLHATGQLRKVFQLTHVQGLNIES